MRLINPELFLDLTDIEQNLFILVLESPSILFNTIRELRSQIDGYDGDFVLSCNDAPIEINKNVQLIIDPFSINMNEGKILKKIQELMNLEAVNEVHYEETNKIILELEEYANSLSFGFDGNVVSKDVVSVGNLIKMLGFEIDYNFETFEGMLLEYLITVNHYLNVNLFCFVNLFSYLEKNQIDKLVHSLNNNHINCIFIESNNPQVKIDHCRKIIIDSDFCQI